MRCWRILNELFMCFGVIFFGGKCSLFDKIWLTFEVCLIFSLLFKILKESLILQNCFMVKKNCCLKIYNKNCCSKLLQNCFVVRMRQNF